MDMSLSMKIPRSRTHLTGVTESELTESGVTAAGPPTIEMGKNPYCLGSVLFGFYDCWGPSSMTVGVRFSSGSCQVCKKGFGSVRVLGLPGFGSVRVLGNVRFSLVIK